jgi:hypothetical protein
VPLHEFLGFVLVIALLSLSFIAARSGASIGLVALAVVWGLVAPLVVELQVNLMSGNWHWVIQVIHLLIGLGAIALGEILAFAIKAAPRATPARQARSR